MSIDSNITLPLIVSICAIVSPIFTTYINNRFQLKMRKIEIQEQFKERNTYVIIEALESYAINIGKCISTNVTSEDLKKYGESYAHAMVYLPENLAHEAKELHKILITGNYLKAMPNAESILINLKSEILRLRKQLL